MKKWILLSLSLFYTTIAIAKVTEEWQRIIDLRGQWKFSIGDNEEWAKPDFDDSDWSLIFAPAFWEDEGYPGYDGYAWYRKSIRVNKVSNDLYLDFGQIDDVDEVYLNGKLIGLSGRFPPEYFTAYNQHRRYHIPASYLEKDKPNIIAIRVFDAELGGGLINGKIGLYRDNSYPEFIRSFEGLWKFTTGDNENWKNISYNDHAWENLIVPMSWDAQGYKDYNGFAWYRFHFRIDTKYKDERLLLSLGKIDDFDEVYLNGQFIGATGNMDNIPYRFDSRDEWLEYRDYKLNRDDLNFDGENVLAIRVFDGTLDGGIYEGPIGIINYDDYWDWRESHRKNKDNFFNFLNTIVPKLFK